MVEATATATVDADEGVQANDSVVVMSLHRYDEHGVSNELWYSSSSAVVISESWHRS
jgi:hypothetical protein